MVWAGHPDPSGVVASREGMPPVDVETHEVQTVSGEGMLALRLRSVHLISPITLDPSASPKVSSARYSEPRMK
ncbi:exo-1,3-beta-D-glucanase [Aspergillus luchuensis]|uniref:Exo-1,3-beta-D-glucanase n=1 Tax=Aspergillus kawachii TaxID=1069201 RepID=A0A146F6W0_ASPKA|nr:exo-1,3-beta-D-glucanase [Aspergillus luchuensis]